MICENCKALLSDDVAFCPQCGTKLNKEAAPVAEETAAPVFEEVAEEASVLEEAAEEASVPEEAATEAPAEETAAEETQDEYYIAPEAPKKPKSKKKIILACVAGLLALCIIGGILLYAFVLNNPAYRFKKAAENSLEALDDCFENAENFENFVEAYALFMKSNAFSFEASSTSEYDYGDWSISQETKMSIDYSLKEQVLGGSLDYSVGYDGEEADGITADFYADKEALYLSCPLLGEDVYSLPLANFGSKFAASALADLLGDEMPEVMNKLSLNLFADISWEAFAKQNPDVKRLTDSLSVNKAGVKIPETEKLTVLSVHYDGALLASVLEDYVQFALTQICGQAAYDDFKPELEESLSELMEKLPQLEIYCGIDKSDRLVALYSYPTDDADDYLLIRLAGEKNPWEEILFSTKDESFGVSLEKTENGFRLSGGERRYNTWLVCNDKSCELEIYGFGGEDGAQIMTYRTEGKEIYYTTSASEDGDSSVTTVRFKPFEKADKPQGTVRNIFDMSADELQQWLMSLYN